jgi:uncharacterized protein YkwD
MHPADIILTVCIIAFTWLGYKQGFISSAFGLIKWAGALLVAALLFIPFSGWLTQSFVIEKEWERPLSFAIVFAASLFLLSLLFSTLQKIIPCSSRYDFVNKITGVIPGFMTGVLAAIMLARIVNASVWLDSEKKQEQTFLMASMLNATTVVDNTINTIFTEPAQQISGANETAYTDAELFKSAVFKAEPGLENKMLLLVNSERMQRGLPMLVMDAALQRAAYNHAADMFTRGYFAHNSPEGTTPFERMKSIGITYKIAGENLAHSYNLDTAHTGLMNSPGHKANILNKRYGKIGVSVLKSDTKGIMVVQEFSN